MSKRAKEERPDKVEIFGIEFTISYVDEFGDKDYGDTEGWTRAIRIRGNLQGEELRNTIIHEALHGLFHVTGWSELLGDKKEEAIVRVLEQGLTTMKFSKDGTYVPHLLTI